MALVFNGTDRLIEVTDPLIFTLDVEEDIYSKWKDWVQIGDNSKYAPAMFNFGGNDTAPGQTAPKFFFLQNYWRVYINNGNVVSVGLNLYTEDYTTPYIVAPGSGVSDRNSDAVNVNEEDIKNQSFLNAAVSLNTQGLGVPGTTYPIGTPPNPSNNWEDTYVIATTRNFSRVYLKGILIYSVANPSAVAGFDFESSSPIVGVISFDGRSTLGCSFILMGLTGILNGRASYKECALGGPSGLSGFSGIATDCGINGNIILDALATDNILFRDCTSIIAGTIRPILDCNGTLADIHLRGYIGGITITNFSGGNNMSIDVHSGVVELDSTCTAGTIVVRGVVDLIDNSGVGCTVVRTGTVSDLVTAGSSTWSVLEKDEVIARTRKSSDFAEQIKEKLK